MKNSISKPHASTPDGITLMVRLAVVVALIALSVAPFWAGRADLRLLMEILCYLALAQMWNLLAGYSGLVSVGQQAFVGLGAYLFFAAAIFTGLPVIPSLIVSAVLTGLIAFPTGWIAFRLNGAYFAIGTWVIAEVFRLSAAQVSALGGGSGISLPVKIARSLADDRVGREMVMYYIAFSIGILSVLLVWALMRSRWGLALTAIRDSEVSAQTVGVDTRRVKFMIYIGTAAMTALTGGFIFLQKLRITPEAAFNVNEWTAFVIFIVVIGGIGTIEGPILGVIVFFALREIAADWGTWYLMLMGALAIIVMIVDKRGIWGAIKARTGIEIFATSRRLE